MNIASTRFTLVLLLTLGAGVLYTYNAHRAVWPVAIPLLLLGLNLGAAIAVNRVFRAQLPLLVFHLALAAVVLLLAAGRLTSLEGRLELSTDESFAGQLIDAQTGPWHRSRLNEASFTNHGFTVEYSPGLKRRETRNRVSWLEGDDLRVAEIGDQHPLVLHGYRFYTTSNKGFAPILEWRSARGTRHAGTIHLPSYPMNEFRQAQQWTPPESATPMWLMLRIEEQLLDPQSHTSFRLPRAHALVVRQGDVRVELRPGERVSTKDGVLTYHGLTTWMGYKVFYDWTLPWLVAACLTGVLALAWHFWLRFASAAWDG